MEAEKRRVPSHEVVELADVNVLLVGHEGAGMSTLFHSFLKLGKKDKSSQSRHVTQTIPYFETTTMRCYIFEHSVISGAQNDPLSDEEKMKQIVCLPHKVLMYPQNCDSDQQSGRSYLYTTKVYGSKKKSGRGFEACWVRFQGGYQECSYIRKIRFEHANQGEIWFVPL